MFAEAIAAAVVGLALLWLVIQPMVLPAPEAIIDDEPLDAEETPRGRALLALKEIEFDRATGKLSDEDFAALHSRYSAIAVQALEMAGPAPADGSDAIEAMIATRAAALGDGDPRFCTQCGSALVADAIFCQQCGQAVSTT
jgi:hypothetical protein